MKVQRVPVEGKNCGSQLAFTFLMGTLLDQANVSAVKADDSPGGVHGSTGRCFMLSVMQ